MELAIELPADQVARLREEAAALGYSLVQNRPFLDSNTRIAQARATDPPALQIAP